MTDLSGSSRYPRQQSHTVFFDQQQEGCFMSTATSVTSDPSRLAPEDALRFSHVLDTNAPVADADGLLRRRPHERRHRSRSRRRQGAWKKLLWVKQSYPDNYTDEETFLDALQRNPRLQPYEFWPLFADSTVIVQQVCTMIVFICCFSGIIQEKVSPVTVVSVGTVGTVLGWVLWDMWLGQEEVMNAATASHERVDAPARSVSQGDVSGLGLHFTNASTTSLKSLVSESRRTSVQSVKPSSISELTRVASTTGQDTPKQANSAQNFQAYGNPHSSLSPRTQQRLATAKSAILIYCALLGLSPILKSLTRSTASDSIWAISFWLMCINVIFFDYGRGVGANFPASLSTNAALMASTVLASRLESTRHVFSLILFSIEVFGLFPVFRRYLRHVSWRGHLCLTWFLIMAAGGGVALVLSDGGWTSAIFGVILGQLLTAFAMGLCSWWLIGLQRYKNEIYGPWDPARPIIRRWD